LHEGKSKKPVYFSGGERSYLERERERSGEIVFEVSK